MRAGADPAGQPGAVVKMVMFTWPEFWLNLTRLIVLLFTAFMAWMTYRSYLLLKEMQPDFNVLLSVPETIVRLVLVGFCLFLAWLSGIPTSDLGFNIPYPWRSLSLGFVIGLITATCINFFTFLAIKYLGRQIYSPWLIRNILPRQPIEWVFVALAFLSSVALEELLFRTLLIGLFLEAVPPALLIFMTSIIFGLMHQPQGKLGMGVAGVINVFFCVLFIWTRDLLITFTAHYTINLLQLVLGHYQRDWLESYP